MSFFKALLSTHFLISYGIHREEVRILIFTPYKKDIITKVKSIKGCKWSKTLRCWHVPKTREATIEIYELFPELKDSLKEIFKKPKQIPANKVDEVNKEQTVEKVIKPEIPGVQKTVPVEKQVILPILLLFQSF